MVPKFPSYQVSEFQSSVVRTLGSSQVQKFRSSVVCKFKSSQVRRFHRRLRREDMCAVSKTCDRRCCRECCGDCRVGSWCRLRVGVLRCSLWLGVREGSLACGGAGCRGAAGDGECPQGAAVVWAHGPGVGARLWCSGWWPPRRVWADRPPHGVCWFQARGAQGRGCQCAADRAASW